MLLNNLTLFLTTDCNLVCTYCYTGKKSHKIMKFSVAKQAIDYFAINCDKSFSNVTLFGGEPLLQQNLLFEIVYYINDNYPWLTISMTTNGTLLTTEVYQRLISCNVYIQISLDGIDSKHDKNRKFQNGQGSWDIIWKNISDKLVLPVRMTVTSNNVEMLAQNVKDLYLKGFRNISFYISTEPVWDEVSLTCYEQQYKEICLFYSLCYKNREKVIINPIDEIIRLNVQGLTRKCLPGLKMISVLPSGTLHLCHRLNFDKPDMAIGCITSEGIVSDKIKSLEQELLKKDEECVGCALEKRCKKCPVENYRLTGSMSKVPSCLCRINQINIIEADKMAAKLYYENISYFKNYYLLRT